MDVVSFIESGSQMTELVGERDGLFHDISEDAQAAAMGGVAAAQQRRDALFLQLHSMLLTVVATVTHQHLRLEHRRAHLASDRQNRLDQRQQLRHIVTIRPGEDGRQRRAVGIG